MKTLKESILGSMGMGDKKVIEEKYPVMIFRVFVDFLKVCRENWKLGNIQENTPYMYPDINGGSRRKIPSTIFHFTVLSKPFTNTNLYLDNLMQTFTNADPRIKDYVVTNFGSFCDSSGQMKFSINCDLKTSFNGQTKDIMGESYMNFLVNQDIYDKYKKEFKKIIKIIK